MVTLCETAPALARRCTALVQGLIPLGMNFMLEVEVTEKEWVRGKYTEEPMEGDYSGNLCSSCDELNSPKIILVFFL